MPLHSTENLSNDFDVLDAVLKGRNHIQVQTAKGDAYINKVPAGFITVKIFGLDGVDTEFQCHSDGTVNSCAERSAQMLNDYKGGGTSQHEHLTPQLNLSDVLFEIERSA